MEIEHAWEVMENYKDPTLAHTLRRMKVPNGWILQSIIDKANAPMAICNTFVPDQKHEWTVKYPEPPVPVTETVQ